MYSVLHVGDRLGLKLLGRACGIAMIRIRSFGVESDSELRNVPREREVPFALHAMYVSSSSWVGVGGVVCGQPYANKEQHVYASIQPIPGDMRLQISIGMPNFGMPNFDSVNFCTTRVLPWYRS